MYESFKNDISFEIDIIDGVQFNFKLDDIQKLLKVDDLKLFKKYLYYLNNFRVNNFYIENYDDAIEKFKIEITPEEKILQDRLINLFIKHEKLFCDEKGVRSLKYVPIEYKKRIFKSY